MSGGISGRRGYRFQDLVMLLRILDDGLARHASTIQGIAPQQPRTFRIEASAISDGPSWDIVELEGAAIIVDEAKSGAVTREDRHVLWKRLRTAIEKGADVAALVPRLTATPSIKRATWLGLREALRTVAIPTRPPDEVATSAQLAEEALYFLCSPPDGKFVKSPALSESDARAMLERFRLDADRTAKEVLRSLRARVTEVGGGLSAREAVTWMRGWADDHATDPDPRKREVTFELLSGEIALVGKFIEAPAEAFALWRLLASTTPPAGTSRLAWQDPSTVQPKVSAALVAPRLALVARGGLGKTRTMAALHTERAGDGVVAWLDWSQIPNELRPHLRRAVELGSWAAKRDCRPITVFVDALDDRGDAVDVLNAVSSATAANSNAKVIAAARATTWADASAQLSSWSPALLAEWDEGLVRSLAQGDRGSRLGDDLIRLLRTPLLLDLFLATFGPDEAPPVTLATRHGLLRAYFERRILPSGSATSGPRRASLVEGVTSSIRGDSWWTPSDREAALALESEGVLVSSMGLTSFRHALLRDFATMLTLANPDATTTASRIGEISDSLTRDDVFRAVVEATIDPVPLPQLPALTPLLASAIARELAVGHVFGAIDAADGAVLTALISADDGASFRQAMHVALLLQNRAWIATVASLPISPTPGWVHLPKAFEGLASVAQLDLAQPPSSRSRALAQRLRAWTTASHNADRRSILFVTQQVCTALPTTESLQWMDAFTFDGVIAGMPLETLRVSAAESDGTLDPSVLRRSILRLVATSESINENAPVVADQFAMWSLVRKLMLTEKSERGLLETYPSVAARVLFDVNVGKRLRWRSDHNRWLREAGLNDLIEERREDLVEDSVDDVLHDELLTLWSALENRLVDDATAVATAQAALESRSLAARLLVLEVARERPELLRTQTAAILTDPRAYCVREGARSLWESIRALWSQLEADTRDHVQRNLLALAGASSLGLENAAALASAIPADDRLPQVRTLVEQHSAADGTIEPEPAIRIPPSHWDPDLDAADDLPRTPALLAEWRRNTTRDRESVVAACSEISTALRASTLGSQTSVATWETIGEVLREDSPRRAQAHAFDVSDARSIFDVTLSLAAEISVEQLEAGHAQWGALIRVAEAAGAHQDLAHDADINARLFGEVQRAAGRQAERQLIARESFEIRPFHWLRPHSAGRVLFLDWFNQRLRDDETLCLALRILVRLPVAEVCGHLSSLVNAPEHDTLQAAVGFLGQCGSYLGDGALLAEDRSARDLLESWCRGQRTGALSNPRSWHCVLHGAAFAIRDGMRTSRPGSYKVRHYAELMSLLWDATAAILPDLEQNDVGLAHAVFDPISTDWSGPETKSYWWGELSLLLLDVVARGRGGDLEGALFQLDIDAASPFVLGRLSSALRARLLSAVTTADPADWLFMTLVGALERLGCSSALPIAEATTVVADLQRAGRDIPAATAAAIKVRGCLDARR